MFDFGFWELALVMLVALIVVGPQRLPRVAAQAGEWLGRMRRLMHQYRNAIQQELQTEELKEVMRQQQHEIQELRDMVQGQHDPDDPVARAVEEQLEARPDAPPNHEPAERRERD